MATPTLSAQTMLKQLSTMIQVISLKREFHNLRAFLCCLYNIVVVCLFSIIIIYVIICIN